ncbi:MAG: CotH kinase family protein, partial [Flavobacteriales bacterium]
AFELIQSEVELGSFMDFWVNELFTLKADRFNNRFWKTKEEDAKWSYVGYDFDIGFVWPINPRTKKNFAEKEAMGIEIFGKCIQNPAFATHFFNRLSDFMNFGYTSEEVGRILFKADSLTSEEFKRDYNRWSEEWSKCLDKGDEQVKKLTNFVSPRSTYLRDSIAPIFGFDKQVLIKNSVPGQVDVFVNGYKMKDKAIYFNDMDIHIELKPIDSSIDFYWQQDGEEVELKSITSYSDNTTLELKKAN